LNPKSPSIIGNMGFLMICTGKYTPGFHLLLKTMSLNPILPWYGNVGLALYYYHAAKYEEALEWAQKARPANMPFVQLVNLIIKEKLKKLPGTKQNGKIYQPSSPITDHGPGILDLFVHDTQLRGQMMTALKSAGVAVE